MVARAQDAAFRPLRTVEYEQLVELGYFRNERLELLEGSLVRMNPQRAPHAAVAQNLTRLFTLALAPQALADIRVQLPFAATDDSMPEPDLAIVPVQSYQEAHPRTASLIVEVSDTTLEYDQTKKQMFYATSGVPEYWVVDVGEQAVIRYLQPEAGVYSSVTQLDRTMQIHMDEFREIPFSVADFFR